MNDILRDFMKGGANVHVKSHYRVHNGKLVYVKEHEKAGQIGTEAQLHERVQHGKNKAHLLAIDPEDRDAILKHASSLGIKPEVAYQGGKIRDHEGNVEKHGFHYIKFNSEEDAKKVHAMLHPQGAAPSDELPEGFTIELQGDEGKLVLKQGKSILAYSKDKAELVQMAHKEQAAAASVKDDVSPNPDTSGEIPKTIEAATQKRVDAWVKAGKASLESGKTHDEVMGIIKEKTGFGPAILDKIDAQLKGDALNHPVNPDSSKPEAPEGIKEHLGKSWKVAGGGEKEVKDWIKHDGKHKLVIGGKNSGSNINQVIEPSDLDFEMKKDAQDHAKWEKGNADKAAQQEADAKAKAEADDTDGFTDAMPPHTAQKAKDFLMGKIQDANGKVSTIKDFIRGKIAAGATVKEHSGQQYLTTTDGIMTSAKSIGKTGMLYAEFLAKKNSNNTSSMSPKEGSGTAKLVDTPATEPEDAPKMATPKGGKGEMGGALGAISAINKHFVNQFPSGKWGFVGAVPHQLMYRHADGSPLSNKEAGDMQQSQNPSMTAKNNDYKKMVFGSKDEALAFAEKEGFPVTGKGSDTQKEEKPKEEPAADEKYTEAAKGAALKSSAAHSATREQFAAKEQGLHAPEYAKSAWDGHVGAGSKHILAKMAHKKAAEHAPTPELASFHAKKATEHSAQATIHNEAAGMHQQQHKKNIALKYYMQEKGDADVASSGADNSSKDAFGSDQESPHADASSHHEYAAKVQKNMIQQALQVGGTSGERKATEHAKKAEEHEKKAAYHKAASEAWSVEKGDNHAKAMNNHVEAMKKAKEAGLHDIAEKHKAKGVEHLEQMKSKHPAAKAAEDASDDANSFSESPLADEQAHNAAASEHKKAALAHTKAAGAVTDKAQAQKHYAAAEHHTKMAQYHKAAHAAADLSDAANEFSQVEHKHTSGEHHTATEAHAAAAAAHHQISESYGGSINDKLKAHHKAMADNHAQATVKHAQFSANAKKQEEEDAAGDAQAAGSGKPSTPENPWKGQNHAAIGKKGEEAGMNGDIEAQVKHFKHAAVVAHHNGNADMAKHYAGMAKAAMAKIGK